MNRHEFQTLAAVEQEHWFYRGKRRIVQHWLKRLCIPAWPGDWIVDVGAGTGIFLSELAAKHKAVGIEYSLMGLGYAQQRASASLVAGSADALPLESDWAGAVIALDVLEHLQDDRRAVAEMARITRPGGYVIVNVPACQSLWSDWDESLGHHRRYSYRSLLEVVDQPGLRLHHIAYINWLPFIPIYLYRRWRARFAARNGWRLEDGVPPNGVNAFLEATFVHPACWPWFQPPIGVSLFCILERSSER